MNAPDSEPSTAPLGPVNGALRFLLELTALVGIVAGGRALLAGAPGWVLGGLAAIGGATAWGRYRVPGDPGPAPVRVPGSHRLALELAIFALGGLGLHLAFGSAATAGYAVALIGHHAAAVPRLRWLLAR